MSQPFDPNQPQQQPWGQPQSPQFQGPPQGHGQPPAPPAAEPKKKRKRGWLLPAVGGFLLGSIIGCAGGVAADTTTTTTTTTAARPAPAVTVTQPGATVTQQAVEKPAPTVTQAVPGPTVTVTQPGKTVTQPAEKAAPAPTVTVTAPAPAPKPPPAGTTIGDGQNQAVGDEIKPGSYKTSGGDNCYWQRSKDDSGSFQSIIANGNPTGSVRVRVKKGDYFTSQRCGTWKRV